MQKMGLNMSIVNLALWIISQRYDGLEGKNGQRVLFLFSLPLYYTMMFVLFDMLTEDILIMSLQPYFNEPTVMIGRRINDFDNFMTAASPRQIPLSTIHNNYHTNDPTRHHSPNRINHTRKPMISPSRSPNRVSNRGQLHQGMKKDTSRKVLERNANNVESQGVPCCSNENHPYKKAQYYIHIEDQDMYYCGVCATQAASQGFAVNKITKNTHNNGIPTTTNSKVLPHYPQYSNNKRYHQLSDLLRNILTHQTQYNSIQLSLVAQHYNTQKQLLNSFYDHLETILHKMRQDHLNDLEAEASSLAQKQTLAYDNLKMHMEELNQVWEDIEANIVEVVENVDQGNYQNCLNTHRKSLKMFGHQLEQYREGLQEEMTTYHEHELEKRANIFEKKLLEEVWGEQTNNQAMDQRKTVKNIQTNYNYNRPMQPQQIYSDRPSSTTLKNVHEMLPRAVSRKNQQNGPDAFRNLFPQDENESGMPQASPQFKAF